MVDAGGGVAKHGGRHELLFIGALLATAGGFLHLHLTIKPVEQRQADDGGERIGLPLELEREGGVAAQCRALLAGRERS